MFEDGDGVHLPLSGLGAVGAHFVMACMMDPDLAGVSPRERSDEWHDLGPGYLVDHASGDQRHDVVEDD